METSDFVAVIATDGSPGSHRAARWAGRRLPERADYHVVTVIPEPMVPHGDETGFASAALDEREIVDLARERRVHADGVNAATARELGRRAAEHHVLHGDAGAALVDHVRAVAADVVIVGSSDHRSGMLSSSVVEHLIDEVTCPVVVVPPTGDDET